MLASDVTYTLTAWAVNEGGEVLSPVASLKVRPQDRSYHDAINVVQDYVSLEEVIGGPNEGQSRCDGVHGAQLLNGLGTRFRLVGPAGVEHVAQGSGLLRLHGEPVLALDGNPKPGVLAPGGAAASRQLDCAPP